MHIDTYFREISSYLKMRPEYLNKLELLTIDRDQCKFTWAFETKVKNTTSNLPSQHMFHPGVLNLTSSNIQLYQSTMRLHQ